MIRTMEDKFLLIVAWVFTFIGFITINHVAGAFSIVASVTVVIRNRKYIYDFIKELKNKK